MRQRGVFFFFLDADDLLAAPDVIERLYRKAIEKKVAVVGGNLEVDTMGVRSFHPDSEMRFMQEGMFSYREYQFDYGYYRFLYNANMLKKNSIFFPSYQRYQDPPFFVRALSHAQRFFVLPITVYIFRKHPVEWNLKKIDSLLLGIIDVARFASEKKLMRLLKRQMIRLIVEYKPEVMKGLYSDSRLRILSHLLTLQNLFAALESDYSFFCKKFLRIFKITHFDLFALTMQCIKEEKKRLSY